MAAGVGCKNNRKILRREEAVMAGLILEKLSIIYSTLFAVTGFAALVIVVIEEFFE